MRTGARASATTLAGAGLRWLLAASVVATAHGAAVWLAMEWHVREAAASEPPPAMMIELEPLAVTADVVPIQSVAAAESAEAEPEQAEPEPEPPKVEPVKPPPPEPPKPEPPKPEPIKPEPVRPPPPEPPKPAPPRPEPPKVEKEKPKPQKPKVEKPKKKVNERKVAARPNSAPAPRAANAPAPQAARSAAKVSGAGVKSVSPASWKSRLLAHLNRHKRFPRGAGSGTAQVAFTIDRSGRVLSARLAGSSGDAVLDGEAVGLLRRASPLPPPPEGFGGGRIGLTVPVRFSR